MTLERQAEVRPEGPGRPNKRMGSILKSKAGFQMILSPFRWMNVSSLEGGLERLERVHKRQRHPSLISTNQKNKTCHLFDATYLTNKPYKI